MTSIDWLARTPQLLAIVSCMVICGMMLPRFKLPAILALTGLTFSLLQAVFYPDISKAARAMFQDQQLGLRFSNLILSAGSAIQITFLILAVFLGRRSQLRQVDAPREHVDFALSQIAAGQSYDQIEAGLGQRGLSQPVIGLVLNQVEAQAAKAVHRVGLRNLILGAVLCSLGIFVTVGTYLIAANSPGGGKYMVTYGLVVAGAIQGIRGLSQLTK